MRPLKSEIKVEVYESNGKDIPIGKSEYMAVLSHWNRGERIVLVFNNQKVTVIANELVAAITRCSY